MSRIRKFVERIRLRAPRTDGVPETVIEDSPGDCTRRISGALTALDRTRERMGELREASDSARMRVTQRSDGTVTLSPLAAGAGAGSGR